MTPSGQMTFCKPLRKRPPSRIPLFVSCLSQATEASPFDKLSTLSSVEGRDAFHARKVFSRILLRLFPAFEISQTDFDRSAGDFRPTSLRVC